MTLPWKLRALVVTGGVVCSAVGGAVILKDAVAGNQYDKADQTVDKSAKDKAAQRRAANADEKEKGGGAGGGTAKYNFKYHKSSTGSSHSSEGKEKDILLRLRIE